jgi:hypothetical protein
MPASDHVEYQKGLFCALRAEPCNCSINQPYIKNAKAKATWWSKTTFARRVKMKKASDSFTFQKEPEAHHLVCCAPVREFLIDDAGIATVIKATAWCINNKDNMKPMPLWGHTIQHYCTTATATATAAPSFKAVVAAPAFKNIPQHDFDHNGKCYIVEIEEDVKAVAATVKKNKSKHTVAVQALKTDLDGLSKKWGGELDTRGKRGAGGSTHAAWLAAKAGSTANWCLPFSMAIAAKVKPRAFPAQTSAWMKRIRDAIWGK